MAKGLDWETVQIKLDKIAKRFLARYEVDKIYPDKPFTLFHIAIRSNLIQFPRC